MPHLTRDGTRLYYEEIGQGSPPVLLLHGWCCDRTSLAPQADHLARDHRVISVDLRGHGLSDAPDQPYPVAAFADDVAWICRALSIDRPLVIGHSLGGLIGLALAGGPAAPSAVVLLDTPLLPPPPVIDFLAPLLDGFRSPAYRDVAAGFIANAGFLPTDDPAVRDRYVAAMTATPQHVLAGVWGEC